MGILTTAEEYRATGRNNSGVRGTAGATRLQEASTEGDITNGRAHLPGAGSLGRAERQHVYGSGFMGQVCAAGKGGRFAEVFDDATVALPLIVRAVLERIGYFKAKSKKWQLTGGAMVARTGRRRRDAKASLAKSECCMECTGRRDDGEMVAELKDKTGRSMEEWIAFVKARTKDDKARREC